jgi:uncharacterized damage-inducible protein DinB
MFLALLGVEAAEDLYGKLEGDGVAKAMAMFARNESLETSMTDKADVLALQRKSLNAVRTAFRETSDAELDRPEVFFGENTTVRRFYMRALCHLHEHMGQLTAYTRAMGMPAPWQAAREARRKEIERQLATAKK